MAKKITLIPLKEKVKLLEQIYFQAQKEIRMILLSVDVANFRELNAISAQERINAIIRKLNRLSIKWAKESVPQAYVKSFVIAKTKLEIMGADRDKSFNTRIHRFTIDNDIEETIKTLVSANQSIKINVNTYLYLTRRASMGLMQIQAFSIADDEIISEIIMDTIELGEARAYASSRIHEYLRLQVLDGKFISKSGRNYNLRDYSKMVARTELRRAQTDAVKNTCREYENDLVQWSSHANSCPICAPYEGHIYSLTGRNPRYPLLTAEPPLHPNSYSKDTDVYTEHGWQNIQSVRVGDKCLSLNPNTLDLEYVSIINLVRHEQAEMIHFCSHDFDLLVTPDHDMFYLSDWKYKYHKKGFEFRKAKDLLKTKSGAFYRSSRWIGDGPLFIGELNMEDFCTFMGYYLSEGSRAGQSTICISQFPSWKKNKIRTDLERMGFILKEYKGGFRISGKRRLNQYLKQFGKSHEKYVPQEIKGAPVSSIRLFLDAYRLGDGSTRKPKPYKGGNFSEERTYFTSSRRMADDIGELILKIGKRPSFYLQKSKGKAVKHHNGTYIGNHDIWVIRECGSQFATLANINRKIINYNDVVYCVQLQKYHTLWVRRNGKTTWCGNCEHDISPTSEVAIEFREARI